MDLAALVRRNLQNVHGRIAAACQRAHRPVGSVTLVAVTKSASDDVLPMLFAAGAVELGESRPQELVRRGALLPQAHWHLIGHLQRNKVRAVLPHVVLLHSVDSPRLLHAISNEAAKLGRPARVLLEVNVAGEASKQGWTPEGLMAAWSDVARTPAVQVEGLMTMAPLVEDPEQARPIFRRLRELRSELQPQGQRPQHAMQELSMGMSNDFEVAIEEGATLVRVGSALFEGLPSRE